MTACVQLWLHCRGSAELICLQSGHHLLGEANFGLLRVATRCCRNSACSLQVYFVLNSRAAAF